MILATALGQLSLIPAAAGPHLQSGPIARCEPSAVSGPTDQILTVNLYVQDVSELYGTDLGVAFDHTIAQVVDEAPGIAGVQILPLDAFLQPNFVLRRVADNTAGTIQYIAAQTVPSPPVTGSGPVAQIRFTAVKPGHFTMVFNNHDMSHPNGRLFANIAQSCSVTFGDPTAVALSGQAATRTPWVGLWLMAGLGVAAVAYGLLRRKRAH